MGPVTRDHLDAFARDGWFVLPAVIPADDLAVLRDECARFVALLDAEMDDLGVDDLGISHRGKRYFVSNRHRESDGLTRFLHGPVMSAIARSVLGGDAYLFWEQYVVKGPEVGLSFAWHQDSGYLQSVLPGGHDPYVTCWCALDDVDEENGTIEVLPWSRSGVRDVVEHWSVPGVSDLVGYDGDEAGVPIVAPAGSVAVFSSLLLHRSGPNRTDRPRRGYTAHYSPSPILDPTTGEAFAFADPVGPVAAAG